MIFAKLLVSTALAAAALAPAHAGEVRFPDDFRLFTHVTTGVVTPGFVFNGVDLGAQVPGLHNIYANRPALQGYRSLADSGTAQFNNGAVIAFDLWEPGVLASGAGSFTFQKQRLAVAVMEKDTKKYAATGGWGFQVFAAGSRAPLLDAAAQQQCFGCHAITPNTDFVFSKLSN
ncbi:MAG: cytochrome P460 family protein [Aquincola sp.]|nr:cytochrome P460 family protein [Aquincola sp.]MDH4289354.1 cytochrome P460 family protein [Aquincola sp.]MDH5329324.1 cytochrome P460 family protein [Aquincola sp.]